MPSNRAITEGESHSSSMAFAQSPAARCKRQVEVVRHGVVDVEGDAARTHQAAPEAAAAQLRREVEEVAAEAPAVRRGGQEADVAGQRAEVADVVGQALQLEGDAAQRRARGPGAWLAASASTTWQ